VDVDLGGVLTRIAGAIRNPRAAVYALGLMVVGRAQKAFQEQKRGAVNWAPRASPNIIGILADLNRGANPPGRRFQPRPAGMDTGNLMASLDARRGALTALASDTVEVGTMAPGASLIQFGGESTQPVTADTKIALDAWLTKRGDPELRGLLAWLLAPDVTEYTTEVPARLLGESHRLGSLEAGKRADLVVFDALDQELVAGHTVDDIRQILRQ